MLYNEDRIITDKVEIDARQSIFSAAGHLAVAEAKRHGLPITYTAKGRIIKEYADGRQEILGTVKPNVRIPARSIKLK
ncbi:MAG: hypothetical protein WCX75_03275 [Fibrobacteraceae bacterium]|jgi:hypothetical protein|nr:MAG: hypothetical protein AUK31_09930 [Fibrobacteres bacterium CG2_30_45_31]